jgi:hypothetical protein
MLWLPLTIIRMQKQRWKWENLLERKIIIIIISIIIIIIIIIITYDLC